MKSTPFTSAEDLFFLRKAASYWLPYFGGEAGDILRGRYRDSREQPKAAVPGEVAQYRVRLPQANHTFQRGHRLMVQVQSSWFPLYDRNPQTFVENIAKARPEDYRAATQRIYFSPQQPSFIELPVVGAQVAQSESGAVSN